MRKAKRRKTKTNPPKKRKEKRTQTNKKKARYSLSFLKFSSHKPLSLTFYRGYAKRPLHSPKTNQAHKERKHTGTDGP